MHQSIAVTSEILLAAALSPLARNVIEVASYSSADVAFSLNSITFLPFHSLLDFLKPLLGLISLIHYTEKHETSWQLY